MSFLRHSRINMLRRRRLGKDCRLMIYKKTSGGLERLITVTKNFFVGRQFSTRTGAYEVILTMDKPGGLTEAVIQQMFMVEVTVGTLTRRYRISTETLPTGLEERWVLQLTAAFNDRTAIVAE